jgi:short-subunit dehydrogenase
MPSPSYRTALITGASSGIGAALARRLAADGTEVVLCARREPELRAQADAISEAGGRSHVVVLDLADARRTAQVVAELDEQFTFDAIIANAGIGRLIPGHELTWDRCEEMIAVNVGGAVATLVGALPAMVKRRRGHLVGVSSIGQGMGMPRNGTYVASKAFLSTFLASLRVDLLNSGIDITDVRPGMVDTPMTEPLPNRPLVIGADEAAEIIFEGMRRRETVLSFPRSARLLFGGFRLLPDRMFSLVMRRLVRE